MKSLAAILMMVISIGVSAQNAKVGTVFYSEKMTFDFSAMEGMDNLPEKVKANLPTGHTSPKILLFNEDAVLYKDVEQEAKDPEVNYDDGEMDIQIKFENAAANDQVYTDLKTGARLESKEFFGKQFLISDDKKEAIKWKMTGEQKEILGYTCMKATTQNGEGNTFEAWFTPDITLPSGPMGLSGLPGLILEVHMNEVVVTATKIELGSVDNTQLVKPSEGKKMNRTQYEKMAQKRIQEQMDIHGGNIIIETHEE